MEIELQQLLGRIILSQRTAALGTLRSGSPFVSMVLYAPSADFSSFYLHISRLAQHTQDILKDKRVSLMIAESDRGDERDPQTLARISILGEAAAVTPDSLDTFDARAIYLNRFPQAEFFFRMSDFSLYRVKAQSARFVAGFGKIYSLNPTHLKESARLFSQKG